VLGNSFFGFEFWKNNFLRIFPTGRKDGWKTEEKPRIKR